MNNLNLALLHIVVFTVYLNACSAVPGRNKNTLTFNFK